MLRMSRRAVISVALAVTGFGLASSPAAAQQNRCEDTPEGRVCTLGHLE
jgi:hypothetical protein